LLVIDAMPKQSNLSVADVVKKVEAAGYQNIYKVEPNGTEYEVKAFKAGKKIELRIDATGEIRVM
jgi:hypothetical protein